ncbi:MAG: outer membrane protein assembly factor BamD [Bacteroidales bacterium]|nr:outer membrane protein assembly factor BamD [Bacteroidales bacterium]
MRFNLSIIILFIILFSGCGEYEKILKSDDYDLKYNKALSYYEQEKYIKAITIFEQILPRFRGTEKSEKINFLNAKSYYLMGNYIMGGHYFRTFYKTYANSEYAEEAYFLEAYCYYQLSPRPDLDQENTNKAINAFTLFVNRFPGSERVKECKLLINELQDKLSEKSYLNARLYYNLGDYKASKVAIQNSLEDYPDTKFREELLFLKLKSQFLLSENSVAEKQKERYQTTLDEYYSFIEEFPGTNYQKEVEKIYESTAVFLKIETTNIN